MCLNFRLYEEKQQFLRYNLGSKYVDKVEVKLDNNFWLPRKPDQIPPTSQYALYKSNMTNGMPQGHFLVFPQKTLDVYEETEVYREEYLFS